MTSVSRVRCGGQWVTEAVLRQLLGGPCSWGTSQQGCGEMEGAGGMRG